MTLMENGNKEDYIYKALETEDENVNKIIEKKKLNGKHWSKIVNNHCCGEYIELFTQARLDSFPLSVTDHLAKIAKALTEYDSEEVDNFRIIKDKTSKLFYRFGKSKK